MITPEKLVAVGCTCDQGTGEVEPQELELAIEPSETYLAESRAAGRPDPLAVGLIPGRPCG